MASSNSTDCFGQLPEPIPLIAVSGTWLSQVMRCLRKWTARWSFSNRPARLQQDLARRYPDGQFVRFINPLETISETIAVTTFGRE